MPILAFDTCFGAVSAAVRLPAGAGDAAARVIETFEPMSTGHAERLLPMIGDTLRLAGIGYPDVRTLAVTLGPGGFTGLRAGIAAARGLALATRLPVVGLSSLEVMALGAAVELGSLPSGTTLAVIVDARRDEVYVQTFAHDGTTPLIAPRLATVAEAVNVLPAGEVVAVGSGAELVAAQAVGRQISVRLPNLQPRASHLAHAAVHLEPLTHVVPNYLRQADAKVQTANVLPRMAP